MSQSSRPVIRCRVPGVMWKTSPGLHLDRRAARLRSPAGASRRGARPDWSRIVSSFTRLRARDRLPSRFTLVVLQRQALALAHVQDLADVALGARPPELVAPRLLDSLRSLGQGTSLLPVASRPGVGRVRQRLGQLAAQQRLDLVGGGQVEAGAARAPCASAAGDRAQRRLHARDGGGAHRQLAHAEAHQHQGLQRRPPPSRRRPTPGMPARSRRRARPAASMRSTAGCSGW